MEEDNSSKHEELRKKFGISASIPFAPYRDTERNTIDISDFECKPSEARKRIA